MQTRGAAKRAAKVSLSTQSQTAPKITALFKTTKRAAETPLQDGEGVLQETRPSKRVKGASRPNNPQPADELPHGLGRIHAPKKEPTADSVQATEPTNSPSSQRNSSPDEGKGDGKKYVAAEPLVPSLPETSLSLTSGVATTRVLRPRSQKRDLPAVITAPNNDLKDIGALQDGNSVNAEADPDDKPKRTPRRTKDNPYGLMPGQTPFPDWQAPSIEECREVHRILTKMHGEFTPPEKIPAPSTLIAGCGEVPDIVDALIRTLISGHTSMQNANLAIQDVIEKYGQWDADSIGSGSIEWNKVRLSEEHEVVDAIKRAGLGPTKGKDIKSILEMVYQDNQQRLAAYMKEKETGETADIRGARELSQGQKDHQANKIESGVLTLDHIRGMTSDEAMLEFTKYPGIGVKTSSCLILFCLQQPSFAVDTHVWRFCKWLKWVPPKASRDDTYMHGEVRIPDDLKYGLHQLFIRHGKECRRCRTVTVEGTTDWESVQCPLEGLLDRFDKRKTKAQPKKRQATSTPSESNDDVAEEDRNDEDSRESGELEDAATKI